ncbi:PREDICTED: uncharacterized protein LOC104612988 [Nelumbo nucifera]|uniref:Uncharacterized protein LOC104612988 n=1 Tax=Nelumbo nucifera TaxID=4432 RepID=A0A1U8BC29_NELNU|nr:PREDICTED: uncharacterized protein LOC104612988 [Nelumbo nucifera]
MLLQVLTIQKPPLISPSVLFKVEVIPSISLFHHGGQNFKNRKRNSSLRAVEKESQFELDQEKAREALKKLDEQLQTLSQKEISPPKKRVSSSNLVSDPRQARDLMREEMPEFSGSYLAYSAFALLIFTIFYNVFFITVIKPFVDGPESAPAPTVIRDTPNAVMVQKLSSPDVAEQR